MRTPPLNAKATILDVGSFHKWYEGLESTKKKRLEAPTKGIEKIIELLHGPLAGVTAKQGHENHEGIRQLQYSTHKINELRKELIGIYNKLQAIPTAPEKNREYQKNRPRLLAIVNELRDHTSISAKLLNDPALQVSLANDTAADKQARKNHEERINKLINGLLTSSRIGRLLSPGTFSPSHFEETTEQKRGLDSLNDKNRPHRAELNEAVIEGSKQDKTDDVVIRTNEKREKRGDLLEAMGLAEGANSFLQAKTHHHIKLDIKDVRSYVAFVKNADAYIAKWETLKKSANPEDQKAYEKYKSLHEHLVSCRNKGFTGPDAVAFSETETKFKIDCKKGGKNSPECKNEHLKGMELWSKIRVEEKEEAKPKNVAGFEARLAP